MQVGGGAEGGAAAPKPLGFWSYGQSHYYRVFAGSKVGALSLRLRLVICPAGLTLDVLSHAQGPQYHFDCFEKVPSSQSSSERLLASVARFLIPCLLVLPCGVAVQATARSATLTSSRWVRASCFVPP